MLRRLNEIIGFTIAATNDEIGSVADFYFDDETWDIRYVIVDTGPWILGKQVLLAPVVVQSLDWSAKKLAVNLTRDQVESSPHIALEQPVSRQYEIDLHRHYGWPIYWHTASVLSTSSVYAPMVDAVPLRKDDAMEDEKEAQGDPHLRSVKEVLGYNIQAIDDDIGHVEDFFADEAGWKIRYILVDTRNWLPGPNVLVGTDWIDRIDWTKRAVSVRVKREHVENSPEYDPQVPLTRKFEEALYTYYHLPGYWL